ncbi:MAG: hypothetical protein KJN90_09360 [Gammaproteobacteria bacterium]|nr:hypothetical protein [Gammaproteobacteria bacterium]
MRSLKSVCSLLIFLLIVSSSQAAEIVTHDSHGHESANETANESANVGVTESIELNVSDHHNQPEKSAHNHSPSQNQSGPADGQNDECFCADICCFSSIDLGVPLAAGTSPQAILPNGKPVSLYQSVALDLFLPPPTL